MHGGDARREADCVSPVGGAALHAVLSGLALGPIMVAGSFAGKRVVDRLSERVFVLIIDLTLLAQA